MPTVIIEADEGRTVEQKRAGEGHYRCRLQEFQSLAGFCDHFYSRRKKGKSRESWEASY